MEALKNWLLKRKFVTEAFAAALKREEAAFATRLFKNAMEEVKEEYKEDIEARAKEIATKQVNDLLSPVDLQKILSYDEKKNFYYVGGELINEGLLSNLKAEAEFLLATNLWGLIQETPRELAQRQMFVAGETLEQLRSGRSILYTLATQKKIVERLANSGKPREVPIHTPRT